MIYRWFGTIVVLSLWLSLMFAATVVPYSAPRCEGYKVTANNQFLLLGCKP